MVTGVTADSNQMRVNIARMPGSMEAMSALFRELADRGVNVDMISTVNENGYSTSPSRWWTPEVRPSSRR
ncbi:hypothetical protein MASR2M17_21770 [Aminivibrio sp.]